MAKFLERRMLLRGAGVAGATAVGLGATEGVASAHGRDHRQGPLGAWKIKRTEPQGTELTVAAILGFAAGGVFTGQDINPVSSTYLGAWESHGSHFTVTAWEGIPAQGTAQPALYLDLHIQGQAHANTISGSFSGTLYVAADDSVLVTGTGTFEGTRIHASA